MSTAAATTAAATEPPSWQQRLAGKRRRVVVLPIQVSEDAGDIAARLDRLRGMHKLLSDLPNTTDEVRQRNASDLAAAEAELAEHVVDVTFQSLPAAEWDALTALYPSEEPDSDGGIAWRAALPSIAAACCTEDGGSDETWWAALLAMDCWSPADLLALWGALVRLHTRAPSARLPFA